MRMVKLGIGVALAILLGCDPIDTGGVDGGATSGSSGAVTPTATGGLQPIGADALCNRLIKECAQASVTQVDCINMYAPLRVTAACVNMIPSASCADLASTSSTVSATCFPGCTAGTAPVCNSDGSLTLCTPAGTTHRNDCKDSCTADGYTAWTGSCGTTYAGEVAAQPQCWCR